MLEIWTRLLRLSLLKKITRERNLRMEINKREEV